MRLGLLGLLFVAFPLFAQEGVSFKNDREGTSFYNSTSINRATLKALKTVKSEDIVNAFRLALVGVPENRLCAYEVNKRLFQKLSSVNAKFTELNGAIYHLRSKNEIDDVTVKILTSAYKVSQTQSQYPKPENYYPQLPRDNEKTQELLDLISSFDERLKRSCFDEAYQGLHNDLNKVLKKVTDAQLEGLYMHAFEKGLITRDAFEALEQGRLNQVEDTRLTLKSYKQKMRSLRTQYPLRDAKEQSNFVSGAFPKTGLSRRQRLLENYTDIQIMLMGNIIKKLRMRLESPKIEILVYDKEKVQETITLEPMERFRFAIKVLRKEMQMLSLNTYFNGRSPDYVDLMSAAYEIGIVPASEVDEIASLEEVWNPTKTFWQKAMVWVRTFSSVATVLIPPPYGFIPALAIVAIEATVAKDDKNDPTGIF